MTAPEPKAPAPPAPEGVDRLGKVISGRYLVRELLGEGGMGSVYLAEHTHMKKRVALKLLHPEMSDNAEVAARFEREAMAASHIEHPNVAAATDFGKTDDGAFFLVLEYIEGTSLRDALESGPISVPRTLRIVRQISLALERAHDAGIVHRDLKPENVMLVKKEAEPDFVKVLDFGIAKLLEGAAQTASADSAKRSGRAPNQVLTRLGTILGTPEYMAPEQALGEAVTPAADLYGVGVIMYEMLTGKHPFDPPDRVAMLSFHIVAPVPLMLSRAPDVEVPAMVEAVVRCLLEKDAKKRYPNARALIEAIDGAAAASGIDAGGIPSAVASQRLVDDRPPNSLGPDAFAKTSFGVPVAGGVGGAAAVTNGADGSLSPSPAGVALRGAPDGNARGAEGPLAALLRLPRALLITLAAVLPLVLVGFVVALVLIFRGPKTDGASTSGEGGAAEARAKGKLAPPDRVKAAVAIGPEGLEALAKEFPEDTSILQRLAIAQQMQGKSTQAIATVKALVEASPDAADDDELVQLVTTIAVKGQGDADDAAFALLEGPLGARGVDALIDLTSRGPGQMQGQPGRDLRARAGKSLAKPEVRGHASPAAGVFLDFKAETSCAGRHELLARAKDTGDARVLPTLKQLRVTRGCGGLFKRGDCWPCMRKDTALEDAITAVEARAPAASPPPK